MAEHRKFTVIRRKNIPQSRIDMFDDVRVRPEMEEGLCLEQGILYLIQNKDKTGCDWARFLCACGCNNEVRVPHETSDKPGWHFKENNKGEITLGDVDGKVYGGYSITGGDWCDAHYFVKDNHIVWL